MPFRSPETGFAIPNLPWLRAVAGADLPAEVTAGPGLRLPQAGLGLVVQPSRRLGAGLRTGAIIIRSVRVGKGRIGARTVVTKDIAAGEAEVGAPRAVSCEPIRTEGAGLSTEHLTATRSSAPVVVDRLRSATVTGVHHPPTATAYLVSQYPALSHEFVAREVRALRACHVVVRTFTVRPTTTRDIRTDADRTEWTGTTALLDSKISVVAAQARLLCRSPGAWFAGLRTTLRSGRGTLRARVWQLFYFGEAALLVHHMHRAGLRHVHVHFANNSADIARIAVAIGTALDHHPWTWSLAMHGPTEFEDVVRHDLAAKVRSASFVACISEFCRNQLKALVGPERWDKLHVVRMSVDPSRYPSMVHEREGRAPARCACSSWAGSCPRRRPRSCSRRWRNSPPARSTSGSSARAPSATSWPAVSSSSACRTL